MAEQGQARVGRVRGAVDAVRMRALPATQNRMASLIMAGKVWYRPGTATWFADRADGASPDVRAERGDGRALRTMRSTGLIEVDRSRRDARGAYLVVLTALGVERYRQL